MHTAPACGTCLYMIMIKTFDMLSCKLKSISMEEKMAFEQIKAEIALLLEEMENQAEDKWELHEEILEKLNELRALGLPLPEDLVELEKRLAGELEQSGKTG